MSFQTAKFIASMIVVLFLVHPILTRVGLKFFTCSPEDMGGPTYLEADFSVECWTPEHLTPALAIGGTILVLYALGIPGLALFMLIRAQRDGLDKWRPTLGFLFSGFE